ncbi:hypothetical protein Tsp_11211 [Trichinella spiralis]|uniref:hypothetical protein n=1 Tax=Trichinella spiralis TaxID=6334 RepID=UPI0001EFEEB8|nr:hypothetical protein Tsp_11211 [Trichinella spiralis]
MKIDRMRRKENPLGWATRQQSIKGLTINFIPRVLYLDSKVFHQKQSRSTENSGIIANAKFRVFLGVRCGRAEKYTFVACGFVFSHSLLLASIALIYQLVSKLFPTDSASGKSVEDNASVVDPRLTIMDELRNLEKA